MTDKKNIAPVVFSNFGDNCRQTPLAFPCRPELGAPVLDGFPHPRYRIQSSYSLGYKGGYLAPRLIREIGSLDSRPLNTHRLREENSHGNLDYPNPDQHGCLDSAEHLGLPILATFSWTTTGV